MTDKTKVDAPAEEPAEKIDAKAVFQLDGDTIKEAIQETVTKALEESEKARKKFYLTNSATNEEALKESNVKSNEVLWLKSVYYGDRDAIKSNPLISTKAQSVTGDGELVPDTFEARIRMAMQDYSEIMRNAEIVTMTSDVKKLNDVLTKVSVAKRSELENITGSEASYTEPVLTEEEYSGATTITEKLLRNTETDLMTNLAQQYAEQLAYAVQNSLINSAVSGSEGLLKDSGLQTYTITTTGSYANFTLDDARAVKFQLMNTAGYLTEAMNGKYYMNPATWEVILQDIQNTASGSTIFNPFSDAPRKLFGQDVVLAQEFGIPTTAGAGFAVYGDLSKHLVVAQRQNMTVKINTSGTAADGTNLNRIPAREMVINASFAQVISLAGGLVKVVS